MRDDLLGRYRLLERIGIGGMAEVFLARATGAESFSRPVVIKRILPQLAHDADAVRMFLDEARLGAKLQHPNIVPVLDLGEVDGTYFMALGWVDGADLGTIDSRLRTTGGSFPAEHVATVLSRVALGLHAAHEAVDPETRQPLQIVHRDVSPSNVLVSRTGEVKVADFGVARSAAQSVRTATGSVKGKISYMAPENLEGAIPDRRSDIYALGVMLWELITRRKLHEGRNEIQVMRAVTSEVAPRASTVNPKVPAALDALAARCLERDPAQRPRTAREVAEALEAWAATLPAGNRSGFERWLETTPGLFDPPQEISGSGLKRTPVQKAKPLVSGEPTPMLKRISLSTPTPAREGLKLARAGDDRPRELVLYVEDEPENRDVASLRLRRNYELLLASSDEEACAILKARGTELSAILMDIQLKGSQLDGVELVQLIRGTLPEGRRFGFTRGVPVLKTPILFVTAYGAKHRPEELMAAGAQRVVAKPVNFAELTLALVDLHLKKAART